MGAAGRERVLPRYAVERLVDDVDGLYRELLAPARASRVTAAPARNAANDGFFWPSTVIEPGLPAGRDRARP